MMQQLARGQVPCTDRSVAVKRRGDKRLAVWRDEEGVEITAALTKAKGTHPPHGPFRQRVAIIVNANLGFILSRRLGLPFRSFPVA